MPLFFFSPSLPFCHFLFPFFPLFFLALQSTWAHYPSICTFARRRRLRHFHTAEYSEKEREGHSQRGLHKNGRLFVPFELCFFFLFSFPLLCIVYFRVGGCVAVMSRLQLQASCSRGLPAGLSSGRISIRTAGYFVCWPPSSARVGCVPYGRAASVVSADVVPGRPATSEGMPRWGWRTLGSG